VEKFKYLLTMVTNQNLIQEDIKKRLNSQNACYHAVQKLLSACLLSKNVKTKKNIWNYNFIICVVQMWILVSHIARRSLFKGVWEYLNLSRMKRQWDGRTCSMHASKLLVRKPRGKWPLGRPRCWYFFFFPAVYIYKRKAYHIQRNILEPQLI
jgi:hypothetical protein